MFYTDEERKQAFVHQCKYGVRIVCSRKDLSTNIFIECSINTLSDHIAAAVAEFMGYWTVNIYPHLNGFAGFDTLKFNVVYE